MQAFINLCSFEKNYFQEHTNYHPPKSQFGPQESGKPRLGAA